MKRKYKDIRGIRRQNRTYQPSTLRKIWARDKGMCVYCGAPAQELDHVIAWMDNGPSVSSNLVCTCKSCNHYKSKHPNDIDMLTRAVFWLSSCGEDTSWMDDFYGKGGTNG